MSPRRLAAAYYAVQGAAVALWWTALALRRDCRAPFQPPGTPEASLLAWAPGDLAILAAGSLLLAWLVARRHAWALPLAWLVAGSIDTATIHALALAWLAGGGWLGFILMAPAALLSTNWALFLTFDESAAPLFRRAGPASAPWNVAKTLLQIALFWGFFLGAVPVFVAWIEPAVGLERFSFPAQKPLAALVFAALSAVGLWSGYTMSRLGQGTPLPLDAPRRLVVAGPYAWIANPMAAAGFAQGFAVGLALGSCGVFVYVLLGAAIWNFVVRPAEEQDLEAMFGEDYRAYRRAVRCWIPRRTPWRGAGETCAAPLR